MAIFGKLKKAFGFSDTDIEEEYSDDLPSAAVKPLKKLNDRPADTPREAVDGEQLSGEHKNNSVSTSDEEDQALKHVPDEIFESVVRFFNDSLPQFLRDSLDVEKQRRQIYDSLDQSMKEYLQGLSESMRRSVERRYADDQSELRREMDAIKSRSRQIEEQSSELKELKLSAERQKRALTERVHDLESRIASFDAEREQYELENKSLVNKLRSASVQENDMQTLSEENKTLREQIRTLKTGIDPDAAGELESLKQQLKEAEEKILGREADLEALGADKIQLLEDVDLLKKKCEIADAMINDLNKRASSAQKALSEKEAETAELKLSVADLKEKLEKTEDNSAEDPRVAELSSRLEDAESRLASADSALEKMSSDLEKSNSDLEQSRQAIAMFEETLTKFEGLKVSKNNAINQLREQLKKAEDSVLEITLQKNAMSTEIQSLKSTIENNLRLQAASEAALRNEIDRLKSENSATRSRRGRKPKETVIDETLDNTDWLISSPPAGENARPSIVSDDEFGYREPKRRDPPADNSSQMLLW